AVVMRRAAEAGLDLVALTDHDTLAGHEQARAALPPGLELVAGMELSCRLAGHSVHMLCYGVDPGNAELAGQCEAIRTGRLRRRGAGASGRGDARLADAGGGHRHAGPGRIGRPGDQSPRS